MGSFVAFNVWGQILVCLTVAGVCCAFAVAMQDWSAGTMTRTAIAAALHTWIAEVLIIRPVLVPLAQRYNCGPALFVVSSFESNSASPDLIGPL